jgi:hypothetical protein
MDQSQSVNFNWLSGLRIFETGKGFAAQAIRRFGEAELVARTSPNASAMLCRAGLEIVANQYYLSYREICSGRKPEGLGGLAIELHRYFRNRNNHVEAGIWEDIKSLSEVLNEHVHSKCEAEFGDAAAYLRSSHEFLSRLATGSPPPRFSMPEQLLPSADRQEEEAALKADRAEHERVLESVQQARQEADQLKTEKAAVQMQLDQVRVALKEAQDQNLLMSRQQDPGLDVSQYRKMVEDSIARIRHLEEVTRILTDAANQAEERCEAAQATADRLQRNIEKLHETVADESAGRARSERQIRRLRRYADGYPGIKGAPEFFAEALRGDEDGLLPPFDSLGEIRLLGSDPYALRFEAVHPEGTVTLRVIAGNGRLGAESCAQAWECESRNIRELQELRGRTGLARVVLAPDEDRPGFVAFQRPSASTLVEFGRRGRRLQLAPAVRFSLAMLDDLAARDRRGMVVSWPDLGTVALTKDGKPLMLEPTATHFGDLGPEGMRELDVKAARDMGKDSIERGWSYVLAHALLRVSGLLDAGPGPTSLRDCSDPRDLRDQLEEARHAADDPIRRSTIPGMAETIVACLNPVDRPLPDALVDLLRASIGSD